MISHARLLPPRHVMRGRPRHRQNYTIALMPPTWTRMPFCIIPCLALSCGMCSDGITLSYPVSLCGVKANRSILARSRPCRIAHPSSRVKFMVTRACHAKLHHGARVMECHSALCTFTCHRAVKKWRGPMCARCKESEYAVASTASCTREGKASNSSHTHYSRNA